jgi:hypothetical protein
MNREQATRGRLLAVAVNFRDGGGDPNQFGAMTWNVFDFTSTSNPA